MTVAIMRGLLAQIDVSHMTTLCEEILMSCDDVENEYTGRATMASTVNKEKNLQVLYIWRDPKNNLDGQDHQQCLNLLHTYGQLKSSFSYEGVVVGMSAVASKM